MGEIEEYLKTLGEIKQKAHDNFVKGNMKMASYYRDKYWDMMDNKGLKGID